LIQAEKIAEIMGIPSRIHSLFDLNETVAHGLPKKTLKITVQHFTHDAAMAKAISNKLVPLATFKRRTTLLSPPVINPLHHEFYDIACTEAESMCGTSGYFKEREK